jgi:hypothetical protein
MPTITTTIIDSIRVTPRSDAAHAARRARGDDAMTKAVAVSPGGRAWSSMPSIHVDSKLLDNGRID